MEVSVYDTIYKKSDGELLKFDIIVPSKFKDLNKIYEYGNALLEEELIEASNMLSADECNFCHMDVASEKIKKDINEKGYSIFKHWGF